MQLAVSGVDIKCIGSILEDTTSTTTSTRTIFFIYMHGARTKEMQLFARKQKLEESTQQQEQHRYTYSYTSRIDNGKRGKLMFCRRQWNNGQQMNMQYHYLGNFLPVSYTHLTLPTKA